MTGLLDGLARGAGPRAGGRGEDSGPRVGGTLASLWLVGPVVLALYGMAAQSLTVFAFSAMIASAAFVLGGVVGFLFGIPRTLTAETAGNRNTGLDIPVDHRPNSNLEQISDWLTKILVGVGLVQLTSISGALGGLSADLAPGLVVAGGAGALEVARVFALAVVLYFLFAGFLTGYLQTRLKLLQLFRSADANQQRAMAVAARAEEEPTMTLSPSPVQSQTPVAPVLADSPPAGASAPRSPAG